MNSLHVLGTIVATLGGAGELWTDLDRDGRLDLYELRADGADRVWLQLEQGRFEEVGARLGLRGLRSRIVTLTDVAGNSTECPAGYFTTVAPEEIPDCVFTLQPVVSNITEDSS